MKVWTYAEIIEKVERDLDLEDESFVSPDELLDYCNEGIDQAEATIHKLHEDYFLTSSALDQVQSTSEYTLPSGIFANKIRSVIFNDGTSIYEIKRIRNMDKFLEIAASGNASNTGNSYTYFLKNPSAVGGVKLMLLPASRETSSTLITIWHIRNANRISSSTDVCDIPEFVSFVIQFMKYRVRQKEGVATQLDLADVEAERKRMIDTLAEMVPDDANEVEQDSSIYREHT